MSQDEALHRLAPPLRLLVAYKSCFLASGQVEIQDIFLGEHRTIGPAAVFFKMRRLLVVIHEGDLLGGTLHYLLSLQRKG